MFPEHLLNVNPPIQLHIVTVSLAALLGPIMLIKRKGTFTHRLLGKLWLSLMAFTAISTFFIHSINSFYGFSVLHVLSWLVLSGCWKAISTARRGDIAEHKRTILRLYFGGIISAGSFAILPGRLMHDVIFTDMGMQKVFALGLLAVGLRVR